MADKSKKNDKNCPGSYYVDEECIACGVCRSDVPQCFKMDENDNTAFVYHQPSSDEEIEKCERAKNNCPVDAIGNDG